MADSTISAISVAGFKSLAKEQRITIAPLTLLAGTNSSGKSSIMQPLLLMKQTLEASYDPGVFLLDGPNVRLTSARQAVTKGKSRFNVSFHSSSGFVFETAYKLARTGVEISEMRIGVADTKVPVFRSGMSEAEFRAEVPYSEIVNVFVDRDQPFKVGRERCFLALLVLDDRLSIPLTKLLPGPGVDHWLRELIHLPGLRGNPERDYRTTGVSDSFPGAFENYVASMITHWQTSMTLGWN
jgi:adenylylsulfate kinase-like enzyme